MPSRTPSPRNIRGQINGPQFLSALGAGALLGLATIVTHLQSTAPDWAGGAAPLVVTILGALLTGFGFWRSGDDVK